MKEIYNIDIKSLLLLPTNVYYLDTECKVLGFNSHTASLFDLPPEECIGLDYEQMQKIGNWTNCQGVFYQKADTEIMSENRPKIGVIEPPLPHPDGRERHYTSTRIPLHNQDKKIVGILGISIETSNVHSLQHTTLKNNLKLHLENLENRYNLSKRQQECLYYLTKGSTLKQIAHILNLSTRTIEHHIESVKIKLGCFSRAQLIEKYSKISGTSMLTPATRSADDALKISC